MNTKTQKQNHRNLTSRIVGRLSNIKHPRWLVSFAIWRFKKNYDVSLEEYEIPENNFESFNAFFTRKLKKEARPLSKGLVSPVDGFVLDYGIVNPQNKICVKNKYYHIEDLIFEDVNDLKSYCILYLSPSNYHRVHAFFDMYIDKTTYLPGTLWSVNEKVVNKKDHVYCRNERIVIHGNSDYGRFRFVLVGAMLVGKIKLSFDNEMQTNIRKGECILKEYNTPVFVKKGEELGYFEMGSSVILLLEEKHLQELEIKKTLAVKVGETLVC
ncbi:archaetidylserine decarboxylase [Bacteroidales bacterium OttesenSCG-928-I21]|nr:archaetidylserine decarboxylase [Bacteroidales bacterium OttesenSCG-928-I21]